MTLAERTQTDRRRRTGNAFLRAFLTTAGVLIAIVAILNLTTYAIVSSPANQQVAQLVSGWDRTVKPLLYESVRPQTAAFGASWVRDAFDPAVQQRMTGEPFFNFGVSGGTAYEAKRFLDSAAAVAPPRRVFLNMDSFFDSFDATRARFGFNEDVLRTREDGSPNHLAPLYRVYALTFSGASMGFNFRALSTIAGIALGGSPERHLRPYEQLDFGDWALEMQALAAGLLGEPAPAGPVAFPRRRASGSGSLDTFRQTVTRLCGRGIAVHAYATPHHMLHYQCSQNVEAEMRVLATLREATAACEAPATYHVFAYPNAVTMEGIRSPGSLSRYYRPDGHPRPTVGALMSARMLGLPLPTDMLRDEADFGADLMAMSDDEARAWLTTRKARCFGEWVEAERERVLGDVVAD